nr:Chain P, Myelin basic protein (MBP)-peptide [synthetic construct]
RGGASQYRPSQ